MLNAFTTYSCIPVLKKFATTSPDWVFKWIILHKIRLKNKYEFTILLLKTMKILFKSILRDSYQL